MYKRQVQSDVQMDLFYGKKRAVLWKKDVVNKTEHLIRKSIWSRGVKID